MRAIAVLCAAVVAVGFASVPRTAAAAPSSGEVVLVAQVSPSADVSSVAADAERGPGEVAQVLAPIGRVSVRVPAADTPAAADALRRVPGVVSVGRAAYRELADVPDDPEYPAQAPYLDAVHAPAAWSRTHGSAAVRVAVVDSGVDVTHPDLAGKIVGTFNAHDGSNDVVDRSGHGTMVAGVAAATTGNGIGVAGIGHDASILAVKVVHPEGSGYTITSDDVARGIIWATENGADVINLSLGSPTYDATERAAVTYALGHGVLLVGAAGNTSTDEPSYPGAYDGVIAVGATDAAGHRATFSSYGSWVTLAAPGVGVRSTFPISTADSSEHDYASGAGTSFATPVVSGTAALLVAAHPDATPAQLRAALVSSAHGYAGLGLGAGQVDVDRALDGFAPASRPSDVGVTGTSGTVTLTARSDAESVRFAVDGTDLPPAPAGTTSLSTLGFRNGTHTVTATDCTRGGTCAESGATASFTVANAAPVLTSPAAPVSGGYVAAATAPAGSAVEFLVDGRRATLDRSAPYSVRLTASTLRDGPHTFAARGCSADGARCEGPTSAVVRTSTRSLRPTVGSATPDRISPNGDRVRDTATVRYTLPDAEAVSAVVRNSAGRIVRGPVRLGTPAPGTRTWTWDGRNNQTTALPDGEYRLSIATSAARSGGTVRGEATTPVTLDRAAPALADPTAPATFYPDPDGYQDSFTPAVTLGEAAGLTLEIRDAAGTLVRTISGGTRAAGPASLSWDGAPPGTYTWTFVAVDAAGNRAESRPATVVASGRRLVPRTQTITRTGLGLVTILFADRNCPAGTSASARFDGGLDMYNACTLDGVSPKTVVAVYQVQLPAGAVTFSDLALRATGATSHAPTGVHGVFYRVAGDGADAGAPVTIGSGDAQSYELGTIPAAGHAERPGGTLTFGVVVDSSGNTGAKQVSDFDVRDVELTIRYAALD